MILGAIACLLLAGIFDNFRDVLVFKYEGSIFPQKAGEKFLGGTIDFWAVMKHPEGGQSWKGKYKDRDPSKGPAFPGATTWLAWTTDGWHLFQYFVLFFIGLAIGLITCHLQELHWAYSFLPILVVKLLFGTGWTVGDFITRKR